ncbi:hypothetical protein HanPI659440_Chr11g0441351 [Helianthus annuus]|nr:hypothetical protein HanPI659440_Chr11g0441351 [Helianthus annuus]
MVFSFVYAQCVFVPPNFFILYMVCVDMVFSLIRRSEELVYNIPNDHVTRDIREGIAKLGYLRFKVLDSAGFEAEASSGSVLGRTAETTANVLRKYKFALFPIHARLVLSCSCSYLSFYAHIETK